MRAHWAYLRYVLCHKWYVFLECVRLGIVWRGITHDLSKFSRAEWRPYVLSFYSGWKKDKRPQWIVKLFERALDHHYECNPHHWNHWLSKWDGRRIPAFAVQMPEKDALEMLADWRAMARQHGGSAAQWYAENRDKIELHPKTRAWLEEQLG